MGKTIEVKLSLPVDIAAKLELHLWDPVRERVAYGARSRLITKLLREHFVKKEEENERVGNDSD